MDIFENDENSYEELLDGSDEDIQHYGTKYHSGRYPYGSGKDPYQHDPGYPFDTARSFYNTVREYEKSGKSEREIIDILNNDFYHGVGEELSLRQYRTYKKLARKEVEQDNFNQILVWQEQGVSQSEMARRLGVTEGYIRNHLKEGNEPKELAARQTADFLKQQIDDKGMIDVGAGIELDIGKSRQNIDDAILILQAEGYPVYPRRQEQVTNPGKYTPMLVACPPGTEYKDIYQIDKINSIIDYTSDENVDGGFRKFQYPESMDISRLAVRYAEEGGTDKDGVIEIRRGVPDLDLGEGVHYSQVRILVDGDRYLKGMAVYADDLPDGVDVRFNTSKSQEKGARGVMKPIKEGDPTNPFGSYIPAKGQSTWVDENGETHLSLINKTRAEGEWDNWNDRNLPSQFLAKQRLHFVEQQLDISMKEKQAEYDEIMQVNNPTVRKRLLETFANDCDSSAVHLEAAGLPRQKYQVILPVMDIRDDEIYAPNYNDGEKVALVRFPYAGYFESPMLTVNNKSKEGKRILSPNALDAVGITPKTAQQLSGADFDGDTVLVLPIGKTKPQDIRTSKSTLPGLKGFAVAMDELYPEVPGMKYLGKEQQQNEMGRVSNLIMDMTLKGAKDEEITRAVKHSMVIIDAEKHKLNYKLSEKENGISELTDKYKGHTKEDGKYTTGASTLITRASSEVDIPRTKGAPRVNLEGKSYYDPSKPEGSLIFKTAPDSERLWTDQKGKVHERTQKSTQMAETDDARKLSSGLPVENLYANYANFNKSLANKARKEAETTPPIAYSKEAAKKYAPEVASLKAHLNDADKNRARERYANMQAQLQIEERMNIYKYSNPSAKRSELGKERKKYAQQAIEQTRNRYGAKGAHIDISDREWEAIQAGAIPNTTLKRILDKTDIDKVRERATPRAKNELLPTQINKIQTLKNFGYSNTQIAEACNVSPSTVVKYLKGE